MNIRITASTWLALLGLGTALYLLALLLPIIGKVLLLLLLTALLTLLIYPLAERLERRGINRGITVAGLLGAVVLLFAYLILQILPLLTTAFTGLAQLIESLTPQLQTFLDEWLGAQQAGEVLSTVIGLVRGALEQSASLLGNLVGQISSAAWLLFVMTVLVFTLVGNAEVRYWLLHFFVPIRFRPRVIVLTDKVSNGLARWFAAQLAISGYYIIAYGAVNTILGIPFGIPIAIIAGLVEFVPYLGGIVGLLLSVMAAATVSSTAVIVILITNTIIGSLAVYFVSPFFYSRAINVPVAAILLGLYVGGLVGGFIAALLTVPMVTILTIVIRELRPMLPSPTTEIELSPIPTVESETE